MNATRETTFTFLDKHKLAVLSTASETNEVWGAAIYYVVDKNLNFYFFTHMESKKYHNLEQHPQAAITIADDYEQMTVQASGKVTEIPIGEELDMAYRKLVLIHPPAQLSWVTPLSKLHDQSKTMILKLTPETLRFSEFKPKSKQSDYMTKII